MVSNSVIETAFSFVINLVFTNAENGCGIARMDTASAIMMTKAAVFCLIAAATFGYPSREQKLILQDLQESCKKFNLSRSCKTELILQESCKNLSMKALE